MFTLEEVRRTYADHEPGAIGRYRYYSVLVPFVEKDGQLHLMYEVRAYDLAADPGEICFPGGHMERGETSAETALRECEEETGIPASRIELIGQGNTLYGYANYSLYTHIGVIQFEDYQKSNPQESEVAELFLVPLSEIMAADHKHYEEKVVAQLAEDFPYEHVGIDENYKWRYGRWIIPVFDAGGKVIWGLTARITEDVLGTMMQHRDRHGE